MREEDLRPAGAAEHPWQAGDLLPGGRYRIELEMGTWGIRSLYAVTDTMTDHPALLCALACAGTGEVAEHVARLAALEHPFLPVIREYVLRDDLLILLLHVASGTTLDAELTAQPTTGVDERTAVGWAIQVAEGLSYLHRQSPPLVVADLAPAALLLTPYGRLKLLGLGPLLGLFSPAGLVGALEPGYAAPEVYSGRMDPLSDIYAAGALLHQAVTGVRPEVYAPGSLPDICSLRPELSDELAEVVARAVALAPEARWQSAAEFGKALRRVQLTLEQHAMAANASVADALSHLAEALATGDDASAVSNDARPAEAAPSEHAAEAAPSEQLAAEPEPFGEPAALPAYDEELDASKDADDSPPPFWPTEGGADEAPSLAATEDQVPDSIPPPAPAPAQPRAPWLDPADTLTRAPIPPAAPAWGPRLDAQPASAAPNASPTARDAVRPGAAQGTGAFSSVIGALGGLFRRETRQGLSAMRATGTVMLAKRMRPKREYPVLVRIIGKPEDEVLAVSFAPGTQIAKTGLGRIRSGARVTVEIIAVPEESFRLPQPRLIMHAPRPGSVTEARAVVIARRPSPERADCLRFIFRDEEGRALHAEPFIAEVTIMEASAGAGVSPSAEMLTLAHSITVLV